MRKISERAVEIMVARQKAEVFPEELRLNEGFPNWEKYRTYFDYQSGEAAGYPHPRHCSSADVLQAMDEYQAEQAARSQPHPLTRA